jgi:hypothetical protein
VASSPSKNTGSSRARSYAETRRALAAADGFSAKAGPPGATPGRPPEKPAGNPPKGPKPVEGLGRTEGPPPSDQPSPAVPPDLLERYGKLRRAVDEEPAPTAHRLLLADTCFLLGRKQEAKGILVKAVDLDPRCRPRVLEMLRSHLPEKEVLDLPLREERKPFWEEASAVLRYPIQGNGPVLMVGGTVIFTILTILARVTSIFFWLPLLFGAGYLSSYLLTIIEGSSRGRREPPDYPDFMNFWDSILGPFWIAFCANLIPAALPVACALLLGPGPWIVIPILAGLVYWPMAMIAGAVFGNAVAPLNVPLVVRAIRVTAREYFPAVLAIWGFTLANWLVGTIVGKILPSLFADLAGWLVGLYFLMVEMDILGRIYCNHDHVLGWFEVRHRPASRRLPPASGEPTDRGAEARGEPAAGSEPPPAPSAGKA